jgi:hypothetical protein
LGISAQTSTNEAQTNYGIKFSKFQSGGAEHFLGTPTTKFEYLGNVESTNVGNKCTNQHKQSTNELWNLIFEIPKWGCQGNGAL